MKLRQYDIFGDYVDEQVTSTGDDYADFTKKFEPKKTTVVSVRICCHQCAPFFPTRDNSSRFKRIDIMTQEEKQLLLIDLCARKRTMMIQENIPYTADEIKAMVKTCKKYNKALETVQEILSSGADAIRINTLKLRLQSVFQELKESEDERIQKSLIKAFGTIGKKDWGGLIVRDILAWLEKQRDYDRLIEEMKKRKELLSKEKEKATSTNDKLSLGGRIAMLQELLAFNICNTTDNDEPKFKVGDWIVQNDNGTISRITKVINGIDKYGEYRAYEHTNGYFAECFENEYHLWTINDAKDGDVLVNSQGQPFIFSGKYDDIHFGAPIAYCGVNCQNKFKIGNGTHWTSKNEVVPATKEQCNFLFAKMKEAGYEWDAEKKELKRIEDKTLNADKVIEWLKTKVYDDSTYGMVMIEKFKQDFGL